MSPAVWRLINVLKWCHLSLLLTIICPDLCSSLSLWQVTLAATSITHHNLTHNCFSCIVGNVSARFLWGMRMCGIKKTTFLVLLHWSWTFFKTCPSWVWRCFRSAVINLINPLRIFTLRTFCKNGSPHRNPQMVCSNMNLRIRYLASNNEQREFKQNTKSGQNYVDSWTLPPYRMWYCNMGLWHHVH